MIAAHAHLTVDGVARRFNPPQTQLGTIGLGIPAGEVEECGDSGWMAFQNVVASEKFKDFEDTVPATLA